MTSTLSALTRSFTKSPRELLPPSSSPPGSSPHSTRMRVARRFSCLSMPSAAMSAQATPNEETPAFEGVAATALPEATKSPRAQKTRNLVIGLDIPRGETDDGCFFMDAPLWRTSRSCVVRYEVGETDNDP